MTYGRFGRVSLALGVAMTAICVPQANAQRAPAQHYEIPAQPLGAALRSLSIASGESIVAPTDLVAGKRSTALAGNYSTEDAVARLLDGSGLRAVRVGDALVIQRQSAESAQDAQGEREGAGGGDILVTGTRIRGRAPAGSSVTTIDRKAILQSGYATTQQVVQALPQNFSGGPNETTYETQRGNASFNQAYGSSINLRGLGSSSTLVLLGGERPPMAGFVGVFTDLSMIPTAAIERIEILPDGASALYGSDAVAGVVNIIPRSNFTGVETSGRFGLGDGFDELQGSVVAGVRSGRVRAMVAYEHYDRGRLAAADRPYVTEDLRRYGLGDFRSGPGLPGTITAGGRTFAIPAGQDGRSLDPSDLIPDARNVSDRWSAADALPQQRRHALFGSVTFDATDRLELYGQGLFGFRRFSARLRTALNGSSFTVTPANPFYVDPIGTGGPIRVRYNFVNDVGQESSSGSSRAVGATGGARYSAGRWQIDAHATYGTQRERALTTNLVNFARLDVALADPNPATAFNPFGSGGVNNPATIDRIRGSIRTGGVYWMWSGQLRADGPLIGIPAGDVHLAVGIEHRSERYREDPSVDDSFTLTPLIGIDPLNAGRRIDAAYAELLLPLSGPDAGLGIGRLDLSAAVRGERYSDFGTTLNPKFGASWEPVSGLVVRGTYGTSFRAPNFNDLRQDAASKLYFTYPLPDPASPTGVTNALIIRGNDPDLGPEKATSWTAGLDVRPRSETGVHATLTYFDIDYRDRIDTPSAALLTFFTNKAVYSPIINDHPDPATVAAIYASPYYVDFFGIPASAITATVDSRNQNLARQHETGLDFDLGYRFSALGGKGEIGASGTYLFKLDQQLTATASATNIVSTLGNPTDFRLRGRVTFASGGFGAAFFANYIGSYRNDATGTSQRVGSWATFDLQLSYRSDVPRGPLSGLMFSLGATNLLNTDPPRTINALSIQTAGYDVENASPIGRVIALQVTKSW